MKNIADFCKMVFDDQDKIEKYNNQDEIMIDEKYLLRITEYLRSIENQNERERCFKDIIAKPNMDNGKVYEFLVYAWFKKNYFRFEEQVYIKSDSCLKKNNYYADGCFEGIVFDVKKFGIAFPLYDSFKQKLQAEIPEYYITIGGTKNLDTKIIGNELISKVQYWKDRLLSEESALYSDYMIREPKYGIEIRAHNKNNSNGIVSSISEIDITQWAEENELYFFHHASQFCIDKPYMIICPFLPSDFHFGSKDNTTVYYAFRYLCRRMFMNLTKKKEQLLRATCDGHAKDHITLDIAARKLSAVIFWDISEEWEYTNCRCWVYKNPNADFQIPNYIIDSKFRVLGAYIDDFQHDNY